MKKTTTGIHSGHTGDVVAISGPHLGDRERVGEILEVLGEPDHVHYRVLWEDGNQSVFYPGSDATIRPSNKNARTERIENATPVETVDPDRSILRRAFTPPPKPPAARPRDDAATSPYDLVGCD